MCIVVILKMTEHRKIWTTEEVSSLIEAFREHGNLWNPKDIHYKNRIKKINSHKEIAVIFNTTPNEIERKIKNINSQYHRERRNYKKMRKIDASNVFKAKWFGYHAMSFLHAINKAKKESQIGIELEDSGLSDETTDDTKPEVQSTTYIIKSEPEVENESTVDVTTNQISDETTDRVEQVHKDTVVEQATQMFQTLKALFERRNTVSPRDEYDVYGEMVGHNIRNLKTEYARLTIQNRIHNLLYEARLGYHDLPSNNNNSNCTVTSASGKDAS